MGNTFDKVNDHTKEGESLAWQEVVTTVSFRKEIVTLANQTDANIREIGHRFNVSRKTIYKWLRRYAENGEEGLQDHPRRPHQSPNRCSNETESKILKVRDAHPAWGARKIGVRLKTMDAIGVPVDSTIHEILRRHQRLDPQESAKHMAWQRFEHAAPNQLWQMDFKGWFLVGGRVQCHPLTIVDDHSRYAVCLEACTNERTETVQLHMTNRFRRYGLPERMTMDNGAPWGSDAEHRYTPLTVWLIRLGIGVSHSRPYHPQTQGKDERFHRTLKAEVLRGRSFRDITHAQQSFDEWLPVYNHERPHQAIGMAVPASRYQISQRRFPEALPAIEYASGDEVRLVQDKGYVWYKGNRIALGKAFHGYPVAFRPTSHAGILDVYFCHHRITQIDVNNLK
jgi:transposase InsO family protein